METFHWKSVRQSAEFDAVTPLSRAPLERGETPERHGDGQRDRSEP